MVLTGMEGAGELVDGKGAAPVPPGARGLMLPSWDAAYVLMLGLELLVEGAEKQPERETPAARTPRMAEAEAEEDAAASE
jgi:hypothetical protein